jgi:hypothetical protein
MHYTRWRKHGDPLMTAFNQPKPTCAIGDCGKPVKTLGWCGMHYERWRLHGSTDERPKGNRDREYTLDEHYFDVIDTPDKAYWLGFIAGDGYVREDRGALIVRLAQGDAEHLRKLGVALGSSAPLRRIRGSTKAPDNLYAGLFIYSMPLAKALAGHGVVQAKSLILRAWDGAPSLMRHYWRGLIDADGTIMATHNQWQVSLVGSKDSVHGFAEWTRSIAPVITAHPKPIGNIWFFGVRGRVQCRAIAEALYGDCSTALDRKRERAQALIAAGPPLRIGHPTSTETKLKIGQAARQRHALRIAQEEAWPRRKPTLTAT